MIVKVNRTTTALLFSLSLLLIGAPVAWLLYAKFQSNERYLQHRSFAVLHQTRTHLDNKFKALAGLFQRLPKASLCASSLSPEHIQQIKASSPAFKEELHSFILEGNDYIDGDFDDELAEVLGYELGIDAENDDFESLYNEVCPKPDSGVAADKVCALFNEYKAIPKPKYSDKTAYSDEGESRVEGDDALVHGINALGSWGCRIGVFADSKSMRASGAFETQLLLSEIQHELFSFLDEIISLAKTGAGDPRQELAPTSQRFVEQVDSVDLASEAFVADKKEQQRGDFLQRLKRNSLISSAEVYFSGQQNWFPLDSESSTAACKANADRPFVRFMGGARGFWMMRCLAQQNSSSATPFVDRNYFSFDTRELLKDTPSVSPFDLMMLVNIDGGVITTVKSSVEDVDASTSFNDSHFTHINDFLKSADDKSKRDWEEAIKPLYKALQSAASSSSTTSKSTLERLPVGAASSFDITIGEMPFRLYIMPYELPYPVISRGKLQQGYLLLTGLIPMEEARASKFSLSPSMAAATLGGVLLLLALWPILRFRFMGVNQAMGANEFRVALAGVALFAMTITLAITDLLVYSNSKAHVQRQLYEIAGQARMQVGDELTHKRQLLTQLWQKQSEQPVAASHLPSADYGQQQLQCVQPLSGSETNYETVNCIPKQIEALPPLEHYFLLDPEGKQVGPFYSWYPFDLLDNERISLATREYFSALALDKGWRSPLGGHFYVEHIFSYSDGLRSTVTSIALPPNQFNAKVAVAEFHLENLLEPVLPFGYKLAMVENQTGRVLYHSQSELSLLENFLVATDHDRDLKLALSSQEDMTLRVNYQGKPHYLTTMSLGQYGIPWSVVVMYDHSLLQIINFNVLLMVLVSMLVLLLCLAAFLWVGKVFTPGLSWLWPNYYRRPVYPWLVGTAVLSLIQGGVFGFGVEHATVLTVLYCLVLLIFNWANLCLQVAHGPLTSAWRRYALIAIALVAALADIIVTVLVWQREEAFGLNAGVVIGAMALQVFIMAKQLQRFPPSLEPAPGWVSRAWAQRLYPLHGGLMLGLVVVLPTLILFQQISKHQIYLYSELSSIDIGQQFNQQLAKRHWLLETLYPKPSDGGLGTGDTPKVNSDGVSKHWLATHFFAQSKHAFFTEQSNGCGKGVFGLGCIKDQDSGGYYVRYARINSSKTVGHANEEKSFLVQDKGFYDYLISLTTPLSDFAARIGFRAAGRETGALSSIRYWTAKGLYRPLDAAEEPAFIIPLLPTALAMILESVWLMAFALLLIGWMLYRVFRSLAERCLGLLVPRVLSQNFPKRGLMRQVLEKATRVPGGVLMLWPGQRKLMRYRRWLGTEHGIHWLDLSDPDAELPMRYGDGGVTSPLPRLDGWEVVVCYNLETAAMDEKLRRNALSLLQQLLERRQSLDAMGFVVCCERSPLYRLIHSNAYTESLGTADNEVQQWAQMFSGLRKFYAWSPSHHGFGLMPTDNPKQYHYLLSRREAAVWPDLRLVHFEFKRWYQSHQPKHFEVEDLETWYIANAGSLYRRKWELCTRDEKVALYQLASGSFINCHNLEVIEHLERGGYIVRDPRLRICNRSFARFVLAAERSEVMEIWLQEASVSQWNVIRIPLLTLIVVAVGAMLYLFNTEMESMAAALAAAPAILAILARGMAFVRGSPPND
ncbi:hypothetical protein EZV61_11295 [Corallincola luteus]|uniref:Cache domain-containing protein n=1 Tax=Corallincola luteus TaxID=1775177 RepID=A0ABY2AJB6_9GAMM|nr:cache domain-containing protein [Corallincola luteus]TCI02873.1 hypothetical protein EZV61_11295 [Corallincola luteus]